MNQLNTTATNASNILTGNTKNDSTTSNNAEILECLNQILANQLRLENLLRAQDTVLLANNQAGAQASLNA